MRRKVRMAIDKHSEAGFTFVEMMLVLVFLSVLAALSLPYYLKDTLQTVTVSDKEWVERLIYQQVIAAKANDKERRISFGREGEGVKILVNNIEVDHFAYPEGLSISPQSNNYWLLINREGKFHVHTQSKGTTFQFHSKQQAFRFVIQFENEVIVFHEG